MHDFVLGRIHSHSGLHVARGLDTPGRSKEEMKCFKSFCYVRSLCF